MSINPEVKPQPINSLAGKLQDNTNYIKIYPVSVKQKKQGNEKQLIPYILKFSNNQKQTMNDLMEKYGEEKGINTQLLLFQIEQKFILSREKTIKFVKESLKVSSLDKLQFYLGYDQKRVAEDIINTLPFDISYFKVYPFCSNEQLKIEQNTAPHILTFSRQVNYTILELIQKYQQQVGQSHLNINHLNFQTKMGNDLPRDKTVEQIRKQLRKQKLDGLQIFTYYYEEEDGNECSIISTLKTEEQFFQGQHEIPFEIELSDERKYTFDIFIGPKDTTLTVKNKLADEIKRIFNHNIKLTELILKLDSKILNDEAIQHLLPSDRVSVSISNNFKINAPARINKSFLILKGQGINGVKLSYQDIKQKKVINVLGDIKQSDKWKQFGIKINDLVLKPKDLISKAGQLFKNSNLCVKNVLGLIVPEYFIFQQQFQNIRKMGQEDYLKKIVIENDENNKHRQLCDSKIKQRANNTNNVHFKNIKSVEPILLYTSSIKVKSSQVTQVAPGPLYKSINQFFRNQQFGMTDEANYKKWEYYYATELLQQLNKIDSQIYQPYKQLQDQNIEKDKLYKQIIPGKCLWRGIGYQLDKKYEQELNKEDQIIMFKQFLSTSQDKKQAMHFALKAIFKINSYKNGKNIMEFSYYKAEKEILFQPYTYFKIINVSQIDNENRKHKIKQYELVELDKPKVQNAKNLFLLWVDDKTKEGRMMWDSLLNIHKSTLMIILLSTKQLKNWLQKNKNILLDQTVQVVMITNMTRIEEGVKNEKAGVEAINTFKQYHPQGYIFVYIGWLQGTRKKLAENNIKQDDHLKVSNVAKTLRQFLYNVAGLEQKKT